MKTNEVYLRHIQDAINRIANYLEGVDRAEFDEDPMIQDAIVRQLEIIGEASRQLTEEFRDRYDMVPWHAIIGMRNRIAHDYLNIDPDIVWEVVKHDLPELEDEVQTILQDR